MLLLLFASVYFLCAVKGSAFPSLTSFGNVTTIAPSGAAVAGCVQDCTRAQSNLAHITWSQMSITATYTAETLLYVVNNRTNSTRTSTIKNTEIDFNNISKPTSTNSAGTVTASFSLRDGRIVSAVYPTNVYEDYASTYSFCGILPTTVNGQPLCLRNPCGTGSATDTQAGIRSFPSHPPLPVSTQTNVDIAQDPRGWTYVPIDDEVCEDQELIQPLFPNLGFWSCSLTATCVKPAQVLITALYLTATSTSHEAGAANSQPTSAPSPPISSPIGNSLTPDHATLPAPAASTSANAPPLPPTTTPSPPPAIANKPESVPAPTVVSQAPPPPTLTPSAPAASPSAPSQQAPGNAANAPPKQPEQGTNPPPPDQQPSSNAPAPSQQAPGNTANTPPKQPEQGTNPPPPDQQPSSNAPAPSQQAPGNAPTTPPKQPGQGTNPPPSDQQIASNAPAPNQQAPESAPTTPPKQSAPANNPPIATIISIAVTSTDAQGNSIVSTAPVPAIPVLQTTTNAQGSVAVSSSFSPLLEANAPLTLIPQAIPSTDAQGSAAVSSSFSPPLTTNIPLILIPQPIPSTNAQNQPLVSLSSTPLPLPTPTPLALLPLPILTTNPQGLSTTITATAALLPVLLTTTNAAGDLVISTSISTALLAPVSLPPLTLGTQILTPDIQNHYIIASQTLTPGGAITVSGTPISLVSGDTAVIIGSSTEGLGGLITAGFGNGPGPGAGGGGGGSGNGSAGVVAFTGMAGGRRGLVGCGMGIGVVVGVIVVVGGWMVG